MKKKIIIISIIIMLMLILIPLTICFKSSTSIKNMYSKINHVFATDAISDYRGTILNVPIDSRPISRSNFEYLVKTAGYNYKEFSTGLDSMNSSGTYKIGNSSTLRSSVKSGISSYNNSNSTAIINLSSYFFGGLIGTRNNEAYANRDTKIEELSSLISKYNKPNYYVIINIPRTLPESRTMDFPISQESNSSGQQLTNSTKVKGLIDYYNETETTSTTFEQATIEWLYIKYWKEIDGNDFNSLPYYVRLFCQDFHNNKYGEFLDEYYEIYTETYNYINDLLTLKEELQNNGKKDFELIVTIDDDKLADFIQDNASKTTDSNFSFIEKDNKGNVIKVGPAYYIENTLAGEDFTLMPGTDELNHMILARDLVQKTGTGLNFTYLNPVTNGSVSSSDWSWVGTYDTYTVKENMNLRANYINEYAKTKIAVDVYLSSFKALYEGGTSLTTTQANTAANNIYKNSNKKAIIGVSYFDEELLAALVSKGNVYDMIYCSAWNTVGNSTGIGLSSIVVGAILEQELSDINEMTTIIETRMKNYMQYKLVTLIEGAVYNNNKGSASESNSALTTRISYVGGNGSSGGANLLNEMIYNGSATEYAYSIGNLQYTVNSATISASRPWNRTFEVKIIPSVSLQVATTQYKVEHYKQNIDGTYNVNPNQTETLETMETTVTPSTKTYKGFTSPSRQTVTVSTDGSTVVKYYYERNSYNVTIEKGEGIQSVEGAGSYKYGQTVTLIAQTKTGYEGITWTLDGDSTETDIFEFTMPAENVAVSVAGQAIEYEYEYKVEHYKENIDGSYNELPEESETLKTAETTVTPTTKTYTGFTSPSVQTVTVEEDGSTIIKYYYTRNSYNVTIETGKGIQNIEGAGTYKYGQNVSLTAQIKTGYEKVTWTVDGETQEATSVQFTMPAKNVAGTVSSKAIEYSITYNLDGGTEPGNPTKYTIETGTIKLNSPIKDGYVFLGWTGEGIDTPTKDIEVEKGSTGNKEYTANWEENEKMELELTVKYSNSNPTNKDVTVQILSNLKLKEVEDWTLSTDNMTLEKVYSENSTESVEVEDEFGTKKQVEIIVQNIDKTNPTVKVEYEYDESENVVNVTISSSEQLQNLEGWITTDNLVFTKKYNSNMEEIIIVKDLAGNKIEKTIKITQIQDEPEPENPEIEPKPETGGQDENKEQSRQEVVKDDTITPEKFLPNAGMGSIIKVLLVLVSAIAIILLAKYKKYRNMIK